MFHPITGDAEMRSKQVDNRKWQRGQLRRHWEQLTGHIASRHNHGQRRRALFLGVILASFTFQSVASSNGVACPSGFTGRVTLPKCTGYIYCWGGREEYTIDCPRSTMYDESLEVCEPVRLGQTCVASQPPGTGLQATATGAASSAAGFPFSVDYVTGSCKNDKPIESWMSEIWTIEECCANYFAWSSATCISVFTGVEEVVVADSDGDVSVSEGSVDEVSTQEEAQIVEYYPDPSTGLCVLNGKDRPSYINDIYSDYQTCCVTSLSWNLEACIEGNPDVSARPGTAIAVEDGSKHETVTEVPVVEYYADTSLGLCKVDGKDRPTYISDVYDDYQTCCVTRLSWNLEACLQGNPDVSARPGTAVAVEDGSRNETVAEVLVVEYYADTQIGVCFQDSSARPSHVADLYTDKGKCCETNLWWNLDACLIADPFPAGHTGDADDEEAEPEIVKYYVPKGKQYYADTSKAVCFKDGPDRPSHIQDLYENKEACCKAMPWNVDECLGRKPTAATETKSDNDEDGAEEEVEYYADTSIELCLPDGPDRPSHILDLYTDKKKCCETNLWWNLVACLADNPEFSEEVVAEQADNEREGVEYYPDATLGMCFVDSSDRPSYIQDLFTEYDACCQTMMWNLNACLYANPGRIDEAEVDDEVDDEVTYEEVFVSREEYYADVKTGTCLPNSPDKPAAIFRLFEEPDDCCKTIPWNLVACLAANPDASGETSLQQISGYYRDTNSGMCFPNGPDRPSDVIKIYDDYDICCGNMLWNSDACKLANPALNSNDDSDSESDSWVPLTSGFGVPVAPIGGGGSSINSEVPITSTSNSQNGSGGSGIPITTVGGGGSSIGSGVPISSTSNSQNGNGSPGIPITIVGGAGSSIGSWVPITKNDSGGINTKPLTTAPTQSPSEIPKMFYPDLKVGVCRSDGDHGDSPYVYSNAEECCNQAWMDYASCISFANQTGALTNIPTGYPTSEPSAGPAIVALLKLDGSFTFYDMVLPELKSDERKLLRKVLLQSIANAVSLHPSTDFKSLWMANADLDERNLGRVRFTKSEQTKREDSLPSLRGANKSKRSLQRRGIQIHFNELSAPVQCDTECQSTDGQSAYDALNTRIQNIVTNGDFGKFFLRNGRDVDLFDESDLPPEVATFELILLDLDSTNSLTWMPTQSPTPFSSNYQTDSSSEVAVPITSTSNSQNGSGGSGIPVITVGGSGGSPDVRTSLTTAPSHSPTENQIVFYPDLKAGVCRSDGNQGNSPSPYVYANAEECCNQDWMVYDSCIAFEHRTGAITKTLELAVTKTPTRSPQSASFTPSLAPTIEPASEPSTGPTILTTSPSSNLIRAETGRPTKTPELADQTAVPSVHPTSSPTISPTTNPTMSPMKAPTKTPTLSPLRASSTPTLSPTIEPTSEPSVEPTADPSTIPSSTSTGKPSPAPKVYYADFGENLCRSDGMHEHLPFVFATAEECCNSPWMNYEQCLASSTGSTSTTSTTNAPTSKPSATASTTIPMTSQTNAPTTSLTNAPTTSPTTNVPTTSPTNAPTSKTIFYPDPPAGFCRSDGFHEGIFFVFESAESCCENRLMDYVSCLQLSKNITFAPTTTPTISPTNSPSQRPTSKPTTAKPTLPPHINRVIDMTAVAYSIADDFESTLADGFPWITGPHNPWRIESSVASSGSQSLRSHHIGVNDQSLLQLAIKSSHGGVLYYSIKADVQMPWSGCHIKYDSVSVWGFTFPSKGWQSSSIEFGPGEHVAMWKTWSPNTAFPPGKPPLPGILYLDNVSFYPIMVDDFESGASIFDEIEFSGDGEWFVDDNKSHEGSMSIRSPADVEVGKHCHMSLEITLPEKGGWLSFWYYSAVWMPVDEFSFRVNDDHLLKISNPGNGWEMFSIDLPPGVNYLSWEYAKLDYSTSLQHPGDGAFWIDDVMIAPNK